MLAIAFVWIRLLKTQLRSLKAISTSNMLPATFFNACSPFRCLYNPLLKHEGFDLVRADRPPVPTGAYATTADYRRK